MQVYAAIADVVSGILSSALVTLPLVGFQLHGYTIFCPSRPWCFDGLPRIYSFVQKHYWGVGFLKYWQPEQVGKASSSTRLHAKTNPHMQIPNFILATPALFLAIAGGITYTASNFRLIVTGGFGGLSVHPKTHLAAPFFNPSVAVHIYPWCLMALVSTLLMHVQVGTLPHL